MGNRRGARLRGAAGPAAGDRGGSAGWAFGRCLTAATAGGRCHGPSRALYPLGRVRRPGLSHGPPSTWTSPCGPRAAPRLPALASSTTSWTPPDPPRRPPLRGQVRRHGPRRGSTAAVPERCPEGHTLRLDVRGPVSLVTLVAPCFHGNPISCMATTPQRTPPRRPLLSLAGAGVRALRLASASPPMLRPIDLFRAHDPQTSVTGTRARQHSLVPLAHGCHWTGIFSQQ